VTTIAPTELSSSYAPMSRAARIAPGISSTSQSISVAPTRLPQLASGRPAQPDLGLAMGCCQPPGGTGPP
jgi:hypothetical protein